MVSKEVGNLYNKYRENKLAHAFLFDTNSIDDCYKDLIELIKKLNESDNISALVDSGNLPSLIVIEPDGLNIKKEHIIDLKNKFSTKPIYSKFNMYIIKNAERLNGASANSLLKFLEEPMDNILSFLITNNKENVIDTIKSRCQIINVQYDKTVDDLVNPMFIEFLNDTIKEEYDVMYLKRKELIEEVGERRNFENQFSITLEDIMKKVQSNNFFGVSFYDFITYNNVGSVVELFKNVLQMLRNNVNIELVLDYFILEMSDINA